MKKIIANFFILPWLLIGCSVTPKVDDSGIDTSITPERAVAESGSLGGSAVLWGGMIVSASNLADVTQLEILAYPLDGRQKPDMDKNPLGRFLARQPGYLETKDYGEGRLITLSGELEAPHLGRIGESDYTYAVVKMRQHYLWPTRGTKPQVQFQFGMGVMIHN